MDCSPPGPSIHGVLQARVLEWVAISFSKRNYRKKESEVAQSCLTLQPHRLQPTRPLHPWNFPGKSTRVGCHFLLHVCMYVHKCICTYFVTLTKRKSAYIYLEKIDFKAKS